MSDRVMYCDREPYDRSSWDILVYDNRYRMNITLKNKTEEEYYSYYEKIDRIRLRGEHNIRMLDQMLAKPYVANSSPSFKIKKIEIEMQIPQCEMLLASLEATTPIQSILQRERKPNEVITLSYLGKELPNIPYNVIASEPHYLTNDEIQLIKTMEEIDILSPTKTKMAIPTQKIVQNPNNTLSKIKEWLLPLALFVGIPVLLLLLISLSQS